MNQSLNGVFMLISFVNNYYKVALIFVKLVDPVS